MSSLRTALHHTFFESCAICSGFPGVVMSIRSHEGNIRILSMAFNGLSLGIDVCLQSCSCFTSNIELIKHQSLNQAWTCFMAVQLPAPLNRRLSRQPLVESAFRVSTSQTGHDKTIETYCTSKEPASGAIPDICLHHTTDRHRLLDRPAELTNCQRTARQP